MDDRFHPDNDQPPPPPDRRYVDRRPRTGERIPPAELAQLIDDFAAKEWPEKPKRKRQPEPPPVPDTAGDDYDRGDQ